MTVYYLGHDRYVYAVVAWNMATLLDAHCLAVLDVLQLVFICLLLGPSAILLLLLLSHHYQLIMLAPPHSNQMIYFLK